MKITYNSYREYTPETRSKIEELDFIICYIEFPEFDETVNKGALRNIQDFFEKLSQEFYHTRTSNYAWGYKVIEPVIHQTGSTMILKSRLFKEENLYDLNSMVVKLFIEYCTIILATALSCEFAVCGIINIGKLYKGNILTGHPDIVTKDDPLVMADLLKVFQLDEIFPDGFHHVNIPGYEFGVLFGEPMSEARQFCSKINSVGIFMPKYLEQDVSTELSILSDMLVDVEIDGMPWYACNWKDWVRKQDGENPEAVLNSYIESADQENSNIWKRFIEYSDEYL